MQDHRVSDLVQAFLRIGDPDESPEDVALALYAPLLDLASKYPKGIPAPVIARLARDVYVPTFLSICVRENVSLFQVMHNYVNETQCGFLVLSKKHVPVYLPRPSAPLAIRDFHAQLIPLAVAQVAATNTEIV